MVIISARVKITRHRWCENIWQCSCKSPDPARGIAVDQWERMEGLNGCVSHALWPRLLASSFLRLYAGGRRLAWPSRRGSLGRGGGVKFSINQPGLVASCSLSSTLLTCSASTFGPVVRVRVCGFGCCWSCPSNLINGVKANWRWLWRVPVVIAPFWTNFCWRCSIGRGTPNASDVSTVAAFSQRGVSPATESSTAEQTSSGIPFLVWLYLFCCCRCSTDSHPSDISASKSKTLHDPCIDMPFIVRMSGLYCLVLSNSSSARSRFFADSILRSLILRFRTLWGPIPHVAVGSCFSFQNDSLRFSDSFWDVIGVVTWTHRRCF